MNRKNALWKLLAYLLAGVVFFCVLYFGLREVLAGWEAHSSLFRFSASYVDEFRGEIWGPLLYTNSFLVQFAYYPALGVLICALLLTLTAWSLNMAAGLESPGQTLIGFALTACLLPVFPQTFMIWPLVFLATGLGGVVWRKTCGKTRCMALRIVYLAFLVFYIREYILVAWVFYNLIDLSDCLAEARAWAAFFKRLAFYTLVIGVLCCVGVWIWQPYAFFSPGLKMHNLGYAISTNYIQVPFGYFYVKPLATLCVVVGIVGWMASPLWAWIKGKISRYITIGLCLLVGLFSLGITPTQAKPMSRFFVVDRLCREYRWQEALQLLNKAYPDQTAATGHLAEDLLYEAQLKTCLLATGKASGEIFTYRLSTFPFLFPSELVNRPESYVTPVYYAYAGNFSESLHQNYDWITSHIYSPVVMREIIKVSLILNDTLPASKFVHIMRQSLFHGKDSVNQAQIERGRAMLPPSNYAVDAYKPDKNARRNFLYRGYNPLFFEYYLALCLLDKNPGDIGPHRSQIKECYPQGMPRHVQEALLAIAGYSPAAATTPTDINEIEAETQRDFALFVLDNLKFQRDEISFADLAHRWMHTYWFYDLYMHEIPQTLQPQPPSYAKQSEKSI
ncbi:hypothetical protein HDR62_04905 [bacterium]|nr:hypothetical protein [bacterium]